MGRISRAQFLRVGVAPLFTPLALSPLGALLQGCDETQPELNKTQAPDLHTPTRDGGALADATSPDTTGVDATGVDATGVDATGADATGPDATEATNGDASSTQPGNTTPPAPSDVAPAPSDDTTEAHSQGDASAASANPTSAPSAAATDPQTEPAQGECGAQSLAADFYQPAMPEPMVPRRYNHAQPHTLQVGRAELEALALLADRDEAGQPQWGMFDSSVGSGLIMDSSDDTAPHTHPVLLTPQDARDLLAAMPIETVTVPIVDEGGIVHGHLVRVRPC